MSGKELSFEQKFYNELAKATVERENKEFELVRPICEDIFNQILKLYDKSDNNIIQNGIIINIVRTDLSKYLWIKDLHKIHNEMIDDKYKYQPYFLPTIFVDENIVGILLSYLPNYYGLNYEFEYFYTLYSNIENILDLYKEENVDEYIQEVVKSLDVFNSTKPGIDMYAIIDYWKRYLESSSIGWFETHLRIAKNTFNDKIQETEYYKNNSPMYHFRKIMEDCNKKE